MLQADQGQASTKQASLCCSSCLQAACAAAMLYQHYTLSPLHEFSCAHLFLTNQCKLLLPVLLLRPQQ